MKLTLLDMTQNIMSSMNSDEVNSISDTAESRQVAEVIRTAYFNILSRTNLPKHTKLFSLDSSLDTSKPTLMTAPATVNRIDWIKYNKADQNDTQPNVDYPNYSYITVLPVDEFLDMVNSFNANETYIGRYSLYDFTFFYRNDKHPDYCCLLEDNNFIFDSYLEAVDDTLQSSKVLCYGKILPVFTLEDNFVPDLADEQFPLLLNEAKSLAFYEMKQATHQKAEQESRRQWVSSKKPKNKANAPSDFDKLPDYGRRGRYAYSSPRLH